VAKLVHELAGRDVDGISIAAHPNPIGEVEGLDPIEEIPLDLPESELARSGVSEKHDDSVIRCPRSVDGPPVDPYRDGADSRYPGDSFTVDDRLDEPQRPRF